MKENKIELLAPAGNFEKLEIAIHYGADAVYLGGKDFNLRNFSENFTIEEIDQAIKLAHQFNVKVYVTCNIYARNSDIQNIKSFLKALGVLKPDAIILADPGVFLQAKEIIPGIPVHLSTQANTTNFKSVQFWESLGIKRINVARETSLKEIREITKKCNVEVEAFVHGSMCISYSGRCLLSSYLANRESNRGMCAQPCRWKYSVFEETRPGQFFPVAEDERGTYFFNSKDLCMIESIPEMIESGIKSLKIEGRMKTINYLATTIKVYREAINFYYKNPSDYFVNREWIDQLNSIRNRGYCSGFYFNDNEQLSPNYSNSVFASDYVFIGRVVENLNGNIVKLDVRNKFYQGVNVEVVTKYGSIKDDTVLEIRDDSGEVLPFVQPCIQARVLLNNSYSKNDIIRINLKKNS